MEHQDGYCDRCGCEVATPQLTLDGLAVCMTCLIPATAEARRVARKPEARDDGK